MFYLFYKQIKKKINKFRGCNVTKNNIKTKEKNYVELLDVTDYYFFF